MEFKPNTHTHRHLHTYMWYIFIHINKNLKYLDEVRPLSSQLEQSQVQGFSLFHDDNSEFVHASLPILENQVLNTALISRMGGASHQTRPPMPSPEAGQETPGSNSQTTLLLLAGESSSSL